MTKQDPPAPILISSTKILNNNTLQKLNKGTPPTHTHTHIHRPSQNISLCFKLLQNLAYIYLSKEFRTQDSKKVAPPPPPFPFFTNLCKSWLLYVTQQGRGAILGDLGITLQIEWKSRTTGVLAQAHIQDFWWVIGLGKKSTLKSPDSFNYNSQKNISNKCYS